MRRVYLEGGNTLKPESLGRLTGSFKALFCVSDESVQFQLSGSVTQVIRKYKSKVNSLDFQRSMLIDLDSANVWNDLDRRKDILDEHKLEQSDVFFMVNAMESWFLSQCSRIPALMRVQLQTDFRRQLRPKDYIKTRMKAYHEIDTAVLWLPLLDIEQLRRDFDDVERLYQWIHSTPHV